MNKLEKNSYYGAILPDGEVLVKLQPKKKINRILDLQRIIVLKELDKDICTLVDHVWDDRETRERALREEGEDMTFTYLTGKLEALKELHDWIDTLVQKAGKAYETKK